MGKAERTTKLLLDLGDPQAGGANVGKREDLTATVRILNDARAHESSDALRGRLLPST